MLKRIFSQKAEHNLKIKANGRYRGATEDEVIETALSIINARFQKGTTISAPRDAHQFLTLELGAIEHEIFAVLWLDTQHRVIAFEDLFRGTIDGASVYPREVVKTALAHNAAACILCHNHPSGVAQPSQADRLITDKLKAALGLIDIRIIDHIVVAESTYSFAEHGLI